MSRADPGFFRRGSILFLGLQEKKGGARRGSTLGPILKSLQRGPKRGSGPPPHPDLPMNVHIIITPLTLYVALYGPVLLSTTDDYASVGGAGCL